MPIKICIVFYGRDFIFINILAILIFRYYFNIVELADLI